MNQGTLARYAHLYRSGHTASSGAATILKDFLELPPDSTVPLSLSHGVDFNHCYGPMDVDSIEPIHWAYNESIYNRSKKFKEALLIPHPWIMLKRAAIAQPGSGTLVIGAPPGPENDSRLLSAIRKLQGEQISILVKKCGNFNSSASFWEQNGIKAVFVNNKPNYFYKSLFHLLSGYANIVGCTFSSAIIFAAALGKHTDLIRDYRYRSYNIDNYLEHVNFSDPDARSFVKSFLIGNQSERERRALSMLGNDYSFDKKSTQNSYINAISRIALPVHAFNNIPSPMRRMIFFFSMMLNRPGISKMNKIRFQQYIRLRRVPIIDMDELSIWKDGINERNFISTNVRYIKGITEPGFAVEQY